MTTARKLTPGELRTRKRASQMKPKVKPKSCKTCEGTGEIRRPNRFAVRCDDCQGSGFMAKSKIDGLI